MTDHFHWLIRTLHWLMAIAVFAMLCIGAAMVSSVAGSHSWLTGLHRPLGIVILLLALLRLAVRLMTRQPGLPPDMPRLQQRAAQASHILLYSLMILLPLVGWATLSAGGYPLILAGEVPLPPLLEKSNTLYTLLRPAHRWLAYTLLLLILAHLAAALFHALIRQDGVLQSMLPGRAKK